MFASVSPSNPPELVRGNKCANLKNENGGIFFNNLKPKLNHKVTKGHRRCSLRWKEHMRKKIKIKIMILPHPSSSHDPNKPLWFLWSPAGHKNNPSDLPHWSQNDFVSRDEYSPTVGSGGRAGARCWKRLVSLLLTLTLTRLWLVLGKIWEKTRLRLHNDSQSWHSLATYSMYKCEEKDESDDVLCFSHCQQILWKDENQQLSCQSLI